MALEHLNDKNFAAATATGLCLVDFWAQWCGPCRMFGPIFETESANHPDIKFAKFEFDEANRKTAAKYNIRSIPSVLAFKDGELIATKVGLMDENALADWIKELTNG